MATISTKELFDGVKDFLEKIGCTDVQIVDTDNQKKESMTTREVMNRLPKAARDRIERFRSDMKVDRLHKELYTAKGSGYIEGLRDSGTITEQEHKMLKCYLTI